MARRTTLRPPLRSALAVTTALAGGLLLALPATAQNLPDTGNVSAVTLGLSGGAPGSTNPVFTTTPIPGGASLRVDLNDNRTLLNWSGTGFNIASGNSVDFRDARATSGVTGRTDNIAVLNRDMTGNMSFIRGSLTADPNVAVYLLNRAGVYIGPGASIDVGALLVSGLDLADDNDFLRGNPALRFNQGAGRVVLGGDGTTIRTHGSATSNGGRLGDVVAFGATIATGGTILADGDVGLVAAADVTVQSAPGSPLTFTIARGSSLVDPFGLISVGGSVTGRNISVAGARSGSASGDGGVQVAGALVATGASVTDRGVVLTAGAAVPGITFSSGPDNADVAATGALTVSGALTSTGDMYLAAADPSAVLGSIAVTRLLDLTGSFDLGSGASPNSGTISAAGIAVHGNASIWNPTTIGLNGIRFDTGALNLNATTEIRGRLAGTGTGFSSHGAVTVYDDIAVTTTGSQYWDAPVTAIGSIVLNVTGDSSVTLESLGDIRSTGGSIGMFSSGTVDARGTVNATQLLGIGSSQGTRVAHAMAGLDMSIRSDKDVVIGTDVGTNAVMTNGKVTIAAGTDVQILGSLAVTGSISGRNISLAATDPSSVRGSVNATGLLDLTGTFDFGPASSPGADTIRAGSVAVHGSAAFRNPTTIGAGGLSFDTGAVSLGAATDIAGDLTGTGTGFSLNGGSLTVGGKISVTTTGNQDWLAPVTAAGSIFMYASDLGSAITAGSDTIRSTAGGIEIYSNGTIDAFGTVDAAGGLTMGAFNRIRVDHAIGAGGIFLDALLAGAKGILQIGTISSATGGIHLAGYEIQALPGGPSRLDLSAGTDIEINSIAGDAFPFGNLVAGRNVAIRAGSIDVTSIKATSDAAYVIGEHGITVGDLWAQTNVYVQGGATVIGKVTAATGNVRIDSSGGVTLGTSALADVVSAPTSDVRIHAGGPLQMLGNVNTRWGIDVSAGGTTSVTGEWTAGILHDRGGITLATSAGDLTIGAGSAFTGGNIVFATPAAFKYFADPLKLKPDYLANNAWWIYSGDPGADIYGGLSTTTRAAWHCSLATCPPPPLATRRANMFLFTYQPTLTLTAVDVIKAYSDVIDPAHVYYTVSGLYPGVPGVFPGDSEASALFGSPLIISPGFAERASVAGGPYVETISTGSLTTRGYALSFNNTGLVTVLPRQLSVTASADNKVYDGTVAANGTLTLGGALSGDDVAATGTMFAFADKNAGIGKPVNVTGTTLTGGDAGNYRLTLPVDVVADILKKALTGTVAADTKIYDGTTAATGAISLAGVVSGDDVATAGTMFSFADRNAGMSKAVSVSGTTLSGADAANYTLVLPSGAFADILKKALSGSVTANAKTYDGTVAGSGTVTLPGAIAGDDVGTVDVVFTFADRNAGTSKTVTVSGGRLTGGDAGNYTLTLPPSALADILKKALSATVTANSRSYDGTTAASGTVTLSGTISGDDVATAGTVFSFADKNAGTGKPVTVTGTVLTGGDAGNYSVALPTSVLADILKKALTGTVTANNKIYDGTTAATGSISLAGVIAGDDVATAGTVYSFADRNVGTGKAVSVTGTALGGADAGNYTLVLPSGVFADILKKALAVAVTANAKTYDGTVAGSGTVTLTGVITGDDVGTADVVFTFADRNAGTSKTVTISGGRLTGGDAGNYTLTLPPGAFADILKKALSATITANSRTYDGTTAASGTVTLSGAIAGDDVGTAATVFSFADKNAGAGKAVTVTGTTLTGGDAGNYTLALPASVLADILKKAITGTVTADGKTYDGTTATTGTIALHGLVSGDDVATSGTSFAFADRNAGTGKTVTLSGTTLSGADAGNYTLTLPASALADILRKGLTANIAIDSKTYDGSTAATGSVTLSGVAAGDNVGTAGTIFAFADRNAGIGRTVTITGAMLNGADAGNYTLVVPATALGTILRRQLSIAPDDLSKTQGEPDPALTFTITGGSLVAGDQLTGALGRDPGELPGRYAILVGTLSAGQNYDLQLAAAQFLIFARFSESGLQPFKVVVLPSQIPDLGTPGGQVTLGTLDLCGDDQDCAASN